MRSKEIRKKISETMKRKGIKPQNYKNFRVWNKGKRGEYKLWAKGRSEEFKKKISSALSKWQKGRKGELSNAYKHGKSKEFNLIRGSKEFKEWRRKVKERDKYTCQKCGAKSGQGKRVYIIAHHIKSFTKYPKLRFDVDNGTTWCQKCHKSYHKAAATTECEDAKKRNDSLNFSES